MKTFSGQRCAFNPEMLGTNDNMSKKQTVFPSRSPDGDCGGGVSLEAPRRSALSGERPRTFSGDATLVDTRSAALDCADPSSSN